MSHWATFFGHKVVTVTATRCSQLRAVRFAATDVIENPRAVLVPVTAPGGATSAGAGLRITYGTSTLGVTVSTVSWSIGSESGTLHPHTAFTDGAATVMLPATAQGLWVAKPYSVTYTLSDGRRETITGRTAFAPADVDGTAGAPLVDLATQADAVDLGGGTSGASDLSGSFTVTHDSTSVVLRATIVDDVKTSAPDAASLYTADSIQFAFAPELPATGTSYEEFGAALLASGRVLYRISGTAGPVTGVPVSVVRDEMARTTTYVVRIPWATAGLSPTDPYFSFSFLVNDHDGSGRKGYIQWGAGIGASKEPVLYLPVQVMP